MTVRAGWLSLSFIFHPHRISSHLISSVETIISLPLTLLRQSRLPFQPIALLCIPSGPPYESSQSSAQPWPSFYLLKHTPSRRTQQRHHFGLARHGPGNHDGRLAGQEEEEAAVPPAAPAQEPPARTAVQPPAVTPLLRLHHLLLRRARPALPLPPSHALLQRRDHHAARRLRCRRIPAPPALLDSPGRAARHLRRRAVLGGRRPRQPPPLAEQRPAHAPQPRVLVLLAARRPAAWPAPRPVQPRRARLGARAPPRCRHAGAAAWRLYQRLASDGGLCPHSQDLADLHRLRTTATHGGEVFYFGEYLSQGYLRVEGCARETSLQRMVDCHLFKLCPGLADRSGWSRWAKRVMELRRAYDVAGGRPQLVDTGVRDVRRAVVLASSCFGDDYALVIAAMVLALLPRDVAVGGPVITGLRNMFTAAEMGCLKGRVSQDHGMPEVSQYHEIIMGLQMAGLTDLPRHEGTARSLIAARKPAPAPDSPPARVAFVPFCRTEARPLEDRSDDDWEFVPR
ncbi:hypothetical protein ACCO45_008040 [Purpureocillium lilacinum]|uniref:Uncharacterized protein n=1 Tax=Purpureocillium lilacinum TaxID=33203 RepID=A0ACC4DMZ9_PURLI